MKHFLNTQRVMIMISHADTEAQVACYEDDVMVNELPSDWFDDHQAMPLINKMLQLMVNESEEFDHILLEQFSDAEMRVDLGIRTPTEAVHKAAYVLGAPKKFRVQ